ncbi:MAG TPA: hypothetical protein VGC67_04320 [Cellulomonas sp.]
MVRRWAPWTGVGLAVAAVLLTGCTGTDQAAPATVEPATAAPTTHATSTYALCAEFPAVAATGHGDLEGWWSSSPADADGSIIEDPDDWPDPRLREHPRVAVVDVASGAVISTWDRTTCGDDPDYVAVRTDEWPTAEEAGSVVLDMDTGEVLGTGTALG